MNVDDPTGRLMRWRLRLSPFDFTTIPRPGRKHQVPDVLFRPQCDTEPAFPTDDDERPNFDGATVLAVHTNIQTTPHDTPVADEHNEASDAEIDIDYDDPLDEDDLEFDAIDFTKPPTWRRTSTQTFT